MTFRRSVLRLSACGGILFIGQCGANSSIESAKVAVHWRIGSGLYTDLRGYPVKVTLAFEDNDDGLTSGIHIPSEGLRPLNSIAESFKRIADAIISSPLISHS